MSKMKFRTEHGKRLPSREGSLTSEIDDLAVIAEFDYPSDEDEVPSYRVTSPFEVMGWSIAEASSHKIHASSHGAWRSDRFVSNGHSQHFGYDGSRTSRDINDNIAHNEVEGSVGSGERFQAKNLQSTGCQTAVLCDSRGTSPIKSLEFVSRDEGFDNEGGSLATGIHPEGDYVGQDTFHKFDYARRYQGNSKDLTDEGTMTEPPEKWSELVDESSMTDRFPPATRDACVQTRNVFTRNAVTCTDLFEDGPTSTTTASQTFIPSSNSAVQVSLDTESEKNLREDLENSMKEARHLRDLFEEIQTENDDLRRAREALENEITNLREYPEKVRNLEEEKNKLEKILSETENRIKNVLNDSEDDSKLARSRLEKAMADLDEKDIELSELLSQLEEHKTKEINLEKVIQDLKVHLKDAGGQPLPNAGGTESSVELSDTKNQSINLEAKTTPQLLRESEELYKKLNSGMKFTSLSNICSTEDYEDMLRKYNNLRKVSAKLQTSVSPLKAKLALSNKKCRLKDDLMKRLLEGGKVPMHLRLEVEESLSDNDHYRALSPLTLTNIDRLEHDLFNHLYEKIPYFGYVDESPSRTKMSSSGDFINLNGDATNDLIYERNRSGEVPSMIKKPISAEDLFENAARSRNTKTSKMALEHDRPNVTKNESVFGSQTPRSFSQYENVSRNRDKSLLGSARSVLFNNVPPPQKFRIEDILGMKNFLFCWEPPKSERPPIIGYELYVNGTKKDFIAGALTSKYSLDFSPDQVFPVAFELSTVRSDGSQSVPSTIVVHGLQKINDNKDSMVSLKLGFRHGEVQRVDRARVQDREMYVAFYDYTPTGFTLTKDGVIYSELGFRTGNLIETFGEPLPNGYILGKIAGSSQLGLIPISFLERIQRK